MATKAHIRAWLSAWRLGSRHTMARKTSWMLCSTLLAQATNLG